MTDEMMFTPPVVKPPKTEDIYADMVSYLVRLELTDGTIRRGMLGSVHEGFLRIYEDPDGKATEVNIPFDQIHRLAGDW